MAEPVAAFTTETFTASDGYRWHYRRYSGTTRQAPRAHVVCVHGIQSHAGWYEYSCTRLSEAGLLVSFLDRRGAGRNQAARGDAPSYRRLLDDVEEFVRALRDGSAGAAPNLPVFLIGISWGGKLAVAVEARRPGLVDGLALLCPGFFARVRPPLRERLAIAWARLVAPRRLFLTPLSDPGLFTASPYWQRFIQEDAFGLRRATARLLVESIRLDHFLRWAPARIRVPVLLLLAEEDRIIDNSRTRLYVGKFAAQDKEVIEYPGARHTLEFEPRPDCFIDDLFGWLWQHARRLSRSAL